MDVQKLVPILFGDIERGLGEAEARAIDQDQGEIPALALED